MNQKHKQKHKKVPAISYRTAGGTEPVRDWLKGLSREDRRIIGTDVATVEFGWPIGMIRSDLSNKRIARVLFCIHNGQLVVLHGLVKKTQKTPDDDLDLAMKRKKEIEE